jgi:hypothetical protein
MVGRSSVLFLPRTIPLSGLTPEAANDGTPSLGRHKGNALAIDLGGGNGRKVYPTFLLDCMYGGTDVIDSVPNRVSHSTLCIPYEMQHS